VPVEDEITKTTGATKQRGAIARTASLPVRVAGERAAMRRVTAAGRGAGGSDRPSKA